MADASGYCKMKTYVVINTSKPTSFVKHNIFNCALIQNSNSSFSCKCRDRLPMHRYVGKHETQKLQVMFSVKCVFNIYIYICIYIYIYIKNNAWVTVNNDFWSRVRWIANDFQEWRSHEWKSLANHLKSDQKLLFTVTNVVFYFLHAILCLEYVIFLQTINNRSFRHCL